MHSMILKSTVKPMYRFLDDSTRVFIPSDIRTKGERQARFYTMPYDRIPHGIVMYASIFPEDSLDVCIVNSWAEAVPISLARAKQISSMMRIPLLVGMGVHCDIESHDVMFSAFLHMPQKLAVFDGSSK